MPSNAVRTGMAGREHPRDQRSKPPQTTEAMGRLVAPQEMAGPRRRVAEGRVILTGNVVFREQYSSAKLP